MTLSLSQVPALTSPAALEVLLRMLRPQDPGFIHRVCEEGVSGFLYFYLTQQNRTHLIAAEDYEALRREYLTNLGRNLILAQHVAVITKRFEESNIPCLVLRGAVFFTDLYPDLGIRPLIDIDLVIAKEHFSATQQVLLTAGFQTLSQFPFFFQKEDVYVDLHLNSTSFWRARTLASALDIRNSEIWAQTRPFQGHTQVRGLGPEDAILSCCEHLQWHSYSRLIWFLDIAFLIQREGTNFDWSRFWARAKALGRQKSAYMVVRFLAAQKWVAVPDLVLAQHDKILLNFWDRRILRRLLQNQREGLPGEMIAFGELPSWTQKTAALQDIILARSPASDAPPRGGFDFARLGRIFRILGSTMGKCLKVMLP